mmetsp:Transcript_15479/g.39136  ORF Transcript_15479/g.39136 Transcript_15479/m.39136 type:complete len:244 (-) Transcript_15479:1129-1860(-)
MQQCRVGHRQQPGLRFRCAPLWWRGPGAGRLGRHTILGWRQSDLYGRVQRLLRTHWQIAGSVNGGRCVRHRPHSNTRSVRHNLTLAMPQGRPRRGCFLRRHAGFTTSWSRSRFTAVSSAVSRLTRCLSGSRALDSNGCVGLFMSFRRNLACAGRSAGRYCKLCACHGSPAIAGRMRHKLALPVLRWSWRWVMCRTSGQRCWCMELHAILPRTTLLHRGLCTPPGNLHAGRPPRLAISVWRWHR